MKIIINKTELNYYIYINKLDYILIRYNIKLKNNKKLSKNLIFYILILKIIKQFGLI